MDDVESVLTVEEWVDGAARKIDRPPAGGNVSTTWDGRRLDTKEKVLAFLAEIDADRPSERTAEQALSRYGDESPVGHGSEPTLREFPKDWDQLGWAAPHHHRESSQ